jgi:hypothetical protein
MLSSRNYCKSQLCLLFLLTRSWPASGINIQPESHFVFRNSPIILRELLIEVAATEGRLKVITLDLLARQTIYFSSSSGLIRPW